MSFGSTPIANSMYHPYMYRGGKRASRLHDMYYVVGTLRAGLAWGGQSESSESVELLKTIQSYYVVFCEAPRAPGRQISSRCSIRLAIKTLMRSPHPRFAPAARCGVDWNNRNRIESNRINHPISHVRVECMLPGRTEGRKSYHLFIWLALDALDHQRSDNPHGQFTKSVGAVEWRALRRRRWPYAPICCQPRRRLYFFRRQSSPLSLVKTAQPSPTGNLSERP